jgi:hypothetical protein
VDSPILDITSYSETDKERRLANPKCTHLKDIKETYVNMEQEKQRITRVLEQVHLRAK